MRLVRFNFDFSWKFEWVCVCEQKVASNENHIVIILKTVQQLERKKKNTIVFSRASQKCMYLKSLINLSATRKFVA